MYSAMDSLLLDQKFLVLMNGILMKVVPCLHQIIWIDLAKTVYCVLESRVNFDPVFLNKLIMFLLLKINPDTRVPG